MERAARAQAQRFDLLGVPAGVDARLYAKRAVVVKKLKPVPIEAIARGYLIGSGWKDYQATGSLCGIKLPEGLRQAEQLPQPIFTPSSKAAVGAHDQNISFDEVVARIGADLAEQVRNATLAIYRYAAEFQLLPVPRREYPVPPVQRVLQP